MLTAPSDPARRVHSLPYLSASASCESVYYRMAVASIALSFCIVPLTGSLSELLHFQYSSLHTAVSLYLPLLFAIAIFLALNRKLSVRLLEPKGLILLSFIGGFWLINYFYEIHSPSSVCLTDYDRKRIWFFVHGVFLCGFAGIVASEDPKRFIRLFLWSFWIIAATTSLAYSLSYRPGEHFDRLLGERALGVGIVAAFGLVSCLSVLLLELEAGRRLSYPMLAALIGAIVIDVAAVMLSATRGAALCCVASVAVFTWMMRKSRFLFLSLATVIVLAYGLVSLAKIYVPEAAVSRLTRREDGFDLRYDLTHTMLDVIARNPYGKTFGYEHTRLYMDYAHNALLQYIGEAGLLSAPVLAILFCGVIWNLVRFRTDLHVRAVALFGLPVLAESFSAGSAYDPLLWFLLFLIFSLRGDRWNMVPCSHTTRPASTAAAPIPEKPSPPMADRQGGVVASAARARRRTRTSSDWS